MSLTARFSRTSASALAVLVALAMLAVGAAPARADVDSLPPTLVGLRLTPDSISTADGHLVKRIRVGTGPHGLCVWPQPGRYSLGHTGVLR